MFNHIQKNKRNTQLNETRESCPRSLTATAGDSQGEIDLIWEPVIGANTYVVQKAPGSRTKVRWINVDVVAKSSCTVSGLKSRRFYYFRVAAVKRKGQSAWSEIVQKKAP